MATLGEDLKQERELRGISLKEIADITKINMSYLRALEEDNLDMLPGKFFTKGIIRAYIQHLGLEEETFLNKYSETLQQQEQALKARQKERAGQEEFPGVLPQKVKKKICISLALVLAIALLIFFYHFVGKKRETPPPPVYLTPSFIQEDPQPPPETAAPQEETGLVLELSFHEKTWLQVYSDGQRVVNGILEAGESLQLKAQEEFLLHIGNAGGFTFSLNGKKGKSFGSSGKVVKNVRITWENHQQFLGIYEENLSLF